MYQQLLPLVLLGVLRSVLAHPGVCNVTEKVISTELKTETYIEYRKQVFCRDLLKGRSCPDKEVTKTRLIEVPVEHTVVKQMCCKGYEKRGSRCVPVCSQICENGRCTGPETCHCKDGYKHFNAYRCVPDCPNCQFGSCVAPGVCACNSGYIEQGDSCVPKCEDSCQGVCVAPFECLETPETAVRHNLPDSSEEKEKTAASIYDSSEEEEKPELPTSTSKPDKISAHKDYDSYDNPIEESDFPEDHSPQPCPPGRVFLNSSCLSQCEIDCQFGQVQQDDFCLCNDGFRNAPNNPCVCEPYCESDCLHGICIGNNSCLCNDGFKVNPEDRFTCMDSTMCHCKNGDCVSEGQSCKCWNGYKLDHSELNYHRCEPICGNVNDPDGCVNGKCVAPFMCLCDAGYIHDSSNNYTCYRNLSCDKCLEMEESNCLPSCHETTTKTLTTRGDLDYDEENGDSGDLDDDEETLLVDKGLISEPDDSVPIITYTAAVVTLLLVLTLIALVLLKKYNKPVDYDINKREQSQNNVYFSNKNGVQVPI